MRNRKSRRLTATSLPDEEGPRRNDNPRLQALKHNNAVRRSRLLKGKVIDHCMPCHRHQEFIRFLNDIEMQVPPGKIGHVILDNYTAHKQPNVPRWLSQHRRFAFSLHPRRRVGGSTLSKGSSPNSPGAD
jgi:hypothetical protein